MKTIILILTTAFFSLSLASGVVAQQQSEPEPAKWQKSWDAFIDELQAHVSGGGGGTDFDAKVRGKVVVWEGTFSKLYETSAARFAIIEFTARHVRRDNDDYPIVQPGIYINNAELPRWRKLTLGSTIRIRVTLKTDNAFGAIFVLGGSETSKTIVLMPQDGELVEVLKSPKP